MSSLLLQQLVALLLLPSFLTYEVAPVWPDYPVSRILAVQAPSREPALQFKLAQASGRAPTTPSPSSGGDRLPVEPGSPARPVLMPVATTAWSEDGVEHVTAAPGLEALTSGRAMGGEHAALLALAAPVTPERAWRQPFLLPLRGPISSGFGMHRAYGDSLEGPHLGIDLAGQAGAAVVAANPGTVVFAGAWEIRGNSVLIDHGEGVYSGYYHLAESRVAAGERVDRGQTIGAVGATGLATGPHVHWDLLVNGTHVPPLAWTDLGDTGPFGDGPAPIIADVSIVPSPLLESAQTGGEEGGAAMQDEEAAPAHGVDPPSVERLARVRSLYVEMLGRQPDSVRDEELQFWARTDLEGDALLTRLLAAGAPQRALAVRRLYRDYIGREPADSDQRGLMSWVESGLTIPEMAVRIPQAGILERSAAIRGLYVEVLGRDPTGADEASLKAWAEGGLTLDAIRRALLESPEGRQRETGAP